MLEEPAPNDRARSHGDADRRAPQPDGLRPLLAVREHVGDQRQCGWEDHRCPETHQRTSSHQRANARGQSPGNARYSEDGQSGEQPALAAEPVRQAPGSEQECGEHEVVRIDHPLELGISCVELSDQRRECDIDHRGLEVDQEGRMSSARRISGLDLVAEPALSE